MRWTAHNIEAQLAWLRVRQGDTTSFEVKAARGGIPAGLAATTCAFANLPQGGTIVLGVDERDNFAVVGVDHPAKLETAIVAQARAAVEPCPHIDTYTVKVSGKNIVVAQVVGLDVTQRPARYRGQAYLRQADGDYVMQPGELRLLEIAKLHPTQQINDDARPVADTQLGDLDPVLLRNALSGARTHIRQLQRVEDDAAVLRMLRLVDTDGALTIAGLYGLGVFPQGPFPSLSVTAAVRTPADAARTRNLETFSGPVPELLEQSLNWVLRNIDVQQQYGPDGHMRDVPEIPAEAIREILANALVHRDLSPLTVEGGRAIDIRIDRRRVVVSSPGGLRNLSVEQLTSAELNRVEVNPHLYRLARMLHDRNGNRVIEGEGGGIQQVLAACEDAGLRPPTFIDTGVKFTAILWRRSDDVPTPATSVSVHAPEAPGEPESPVEQALAEVDVSDLGKNAPRVFAAIRGAGELHLEDVMDRTGLSESQVRYALRPLTRAGYVQVRGGQGVSGTVYFA